MALCGMVFEFCSTSDDQIHDSGCYRCCANAIDALVEAGYMEYAKGQEAQTGRWRYARFTPKAGSPYFYRDVVDVIDVKALP